MIRKIVKQGTATMTISLPAKWIKHNNLKEGDQLNLLLNNNQIHIVTQKQEEQLKASINTKELGAFTKNNLGHYYMLGYHEVKINSEDQHLLQDIQNRVQNYIGFEVIDQTKSSITIKSLSSALDEEFDTLLIKVFRIFKEMSNDIYNALKNNPTELKNIKERELTADRFCLFLQRLINQKGYKQHNRSLQAYDMIANLERIGDIYKYICQEYQDNKKQIHKSTLQNLKNINTYYHTLVDTLLKTTPQRRVYLYNNRKPLTDSTVALLKNNRDPLLNARLLQLIENIYNVANSYAATLCN